MHGHGSFSDPALGIAIQQTPDRVTPVLPVLRAYQLSLNTPPLKNHQYRTTPLRALWQHPPYFHDGSAATLLDVVGHYDRFFGLGLSPQEKADLVEYLKSL